MKHVVLGLGLMFLVAGSSACDMKSSSVRQNWEYKCWESDRADGKHKGFVKYTEMELNKLGAQGWEMVGYAMNNGANVRYVCFKRPKADK